MKGKGSLEKTSVDWESRGRSSKPVQFYHLDNSSFLHVRYCVYKMVSGLSKCSMLKLMLTKETEINLFPKEDLFGWNIFT